MMGLSFSHLGQVCAHMFQGDFLGFLISLWCKLLYRLSQKTACRKGWWVEDLVCSRGVDYQEFWTSIWGWPADGDCQRFEGVCECLLCEWHLFNVYLS